MTPEEWTAWQRQQTTDSGNSADGWIRVARRLIKAASILQERHNEAMKLFLRNVLNGGPSADTYTTDELEAMENGRDLLTVSLMLFGFALECLIKALFLKNGNRLYQDGKRTAPRKLARVHNLQEMAFALGVAEIFTADEISVLDRVSAENERGRYPAFSNHTSYSPSFPVDGKIEQHYMTWGSNQTFTLAQCAMKLFDKLETDHAPGLDVFIETRRLEERAYRIPEPM